MLDQVRARLAPRAEAPVSSGLPDEQTQDLFDRVTSLEPWFHAIDLGHGVVTPRRIEPRDYPRRLWKSVRQALPASLAGLTVLDIGCNAGYMSLEVKRLGADRVVGIDVLQQIADDFAADWLEQARFAAKSVGVDIEYRGQDVMEVHEAFDVVLFLGVAYHLRHPLLVLERLARITRRQLIVESLVMAGGDPDLRFQEVGYRGDASVKWIPTKSALAAMLREVGFTDIHEIPYQHGRVVLAATAPDQAGRTDTREPDAG